MPVYFVVVETRGYVLDVELNGGPILGVTDPYTNVLRQCSEWVVRGTNRLAVRVRERLPPEAFEGTADEYLFRVELAVGQGLTIPEETELSTVARIVLPESPAADWSPLWVTTTADLDPGFPRWRWQDAEKLILDPAEISALNDYVRRRHQELSARDLSAVVRDSEIILDEVPPVYGTSTGEATASVREFHQRLFATRAFALAPLVPDEYRFVRCCDDRLVTVRTRDDNPVLRSASYERGGGWSIDFWAGLVEGAWRRLR